MSTSKGGAEDLSDKPSPEHVMYLILYILSTEQQLTKESETCGKKKLQKICDHNIE